MAQELEDARNKLSDASERQRVARDILERTVIRAPVTGTVLGLSVNTIGGVVQKGDRMLEIVPSDADTIIKARLKPADGIEVQPGMRAELRILSAQGRRLPMVHGVVRKRSADTRADPATQTAYMEVDVALEAGEVRMLEDVKLVPGTPVEIIIPTGSRTVLDYFLEPLAVSMRHGLREH
jgi:HlyD family type I secretion membrane fusion protein